MNQQQNLANALKGTKKRHLPTSEFEGKFHCKHDFVKYFREQRKHLPFFSSHTRLTPSDACVVQLYLPDDLMFNKDFLRQVLTEEKELLEIDRVKFVNVPHYDEVSVKRLWP